MTHEWFYTLYSLTIPESVRRTFCTILQTLHVTEQLPQNGQYQFTGIVRLSEIFLWGMLRRLCHISIGFIQTICANRSKPDTRECTVLCMINVMSTVCAAVVNVGSHAVEVTKQNWRVSKSSEWFIWRRSLETATNLWYPYQIRHYKRWNEVHSVSRRVIVAESMKETLAKHEGDAAERRPHFYFVHRAVDICFGLMWESNSHNLSNWSRGMKNASLERYICGTSKQLNIHQFIAKCSYIFPAHIVIV